MASTSVRISRVTHETLKGLAEREHRSLGEVLDAAISQYQERRFWEDTRAAYDRLRGNPEAWQDYRDELAEWDATLMDGLDPNERFDDEPGHGS